MGREEQRAQVRRMREALIEELEGVYRRAFDAISTEAVQHAAQRWLLEPSLCACGPEDSLRALEEHWQHQRLRLVPSAAALPH